MSARVLSIAAALLTLTIAASGPAVAPVRAEALETDDALVAPLGVGSARRRPARRRHARDRHRARLGRAIEPLPRRHLRRLPADLVGDAQDLGRLDRHDPQHLGRADRPDRAQHDRRPPRQHPAPLGDRRRGRGRLRRGATRRSSSRSAASCRSTPRPRSGSASTPPCGAACRARTGCSPRPTGSSTSTAGCRGSAARSPSTGRTTATRSRRRRAARSGSRSRRRASWSWPPAATGPRSAPTA